MLKGFICIFITLTLLCGQADYEQWLETQQEDYQNYLARYDADFANFLDEDWQEFKSFSGLKWDETPKPEIPPVAEEPPSPPPGPPVILPEPPREFPERPEVVPPVNPDAGGPPLQVEFFGITVEFTPGQEPLPELQRPIDNHAISAYWLALSKQNTEQLLSQLSWDEDVLGLNDWGYGYLVHAAAVALVGEPSPEAELLTWHLLIRSGYNIKAGYFDDQVVLLTAATPTIYNVPFFEIEGQRYFANIFKKGADKMLKLKTYSGDYPKAGRPMDISLLVLPRIGNEEITKTYSFTYQSKAYAPELEYNASLMTFFEAYPQTDLAVYFASAPSPGARSSLYTAFTPLVEEKSRTEGLDLILRFVQTAFAYETDDDQFGYEKPLFADETLHYPYCDCEDRSVLFARMTEDLLGLETVGLRYPGHVAVGVRLSEPAISGDHVQVDGVDFLICDPTYINAGIGMCMPQFKEVKPDIIKF